MASVLKFLPLDRVDPNPYQTRLGENKEHIESLARDILAHGMMQTPAGRMINDDERCQLAFGHSRFAAYKLLVELGHEEFEDFPVNIMDLTDEQMAVASWSENEKRRDLNPVERAEAIRRRIDEFGWTQQELAEKLDIDRTSVSNALRLLKLPEKIQDNLRSGILTTRQAMSLLPYYELKTEEIVKIENQYNDELFDFLQLARNGELSSDAIRERLSGYMRLVHPEEQVDLPELPLIAAVEAGIVAEQEDQNQLTRSREETLSLEEHKNGEQELSEPEPGEQEDQDHLTQSHRGHGEELSLEEPGEQEEEERLLQEEPENDEEPEMVEGSDVESDAPAEPVVTASETAPAPVPSAKPVPAPTPAPSMIKPAEEQMLTITWLKTGGVSISLRKVGMIAPKFRFLQFEEGQTTDVLLSAIEEIMCE